MPAESGCVLTTARVYNLLTPNEVVMQLTELGKELDAVVSTLRDAEIDAIQKRHRADIAESRAFVEASGPVEQRKHLARLSADKLEEQALVAEAVIRYLRAKVRAIDTRIEIGRSYGAAVRAELKTLGYGESA